MKRKPAFFLAILISTLLVIYAGHRAQHASMTMDESGTFLNHISKPLKEILTNTPRPDGNNHILNTLLIKVTTGLFGSNSLTVRLPNVFALALYLFFGIALITKINQRHFALFLGLALIIANPFLFDFFSIARGYGLACGFMMGSIYFWYSFLEDSNWKRLLPSFLFAILAVYSNFVWLNYFVALVGCFCIWLFQNHYKKKNYFEKNLVLTVLLSIILLVALIIIPLSNLQSSGLFTKGFWGQRDFWMDTYHPLIEEYFYRKIYWKTNIIEFVKIAVPAILLTMFLKLIFQSIKKLALTLNDKFSWSLLMFILIISFSTIAQNILFGTDFLVTRTALIFYPLFGLAIFMFLSMNWPKIENWLKWLYLSITFFAALHFYNAHRPYFFLEWYMSGKVKTVIELIEETQKNTEGKVSLGTHWSCSQAANFYITTNSNSKIKWVPWDKNIRKNAPYDYYLVPIESVNDIHPSYKKVEDYGFNVLYAKRSDEI